MILHIAQKSDKFEILPLSSYGKRTIKKTRTIRMIVVMEVEYAYEKEQPYTLEEKT
jgi:hypothetical protein